MEEVHEFHQFFNVVGERGKGLNIWRSYLKIIREAQTLIVALGGIDICENPRKEGSDLLMSSAMALVDRIRNYCNYMGTKLIVCQILTRTSSVDSRKINSQLNKKLKQKYGPLFRSFTTNLVRLKVYVHFSDETYLALSSEIEIFSISAPAPRMDKVNPNLLPNQS